MSDVISFYVPRSNTLHTLRLGLTLIHFIESDFTYFGEQCIEAAQKYQRTGENTLEKASVLKEYIRSCHPYCSALINTEFNKIVIDCIIDYLCTSNNVGLEELWVKNLSSKDAFGQAIFQRISEYKTGHSINQWKNLLRMQVYTASKMAVIYGGEEVSQAEHRAKKLFFDMAFRLAAQELGNKNDELPYVKRYSVPFLAESPSMLKNAANTLEPMVKSMIGGRKAKTETLLSKYSSKPYVKVRNCVHDQTAGMAVNAMMDIRSPLSSEITQFIKMYSELPDEVYEPSSFKAIIDLEFDKLLENGLYLQPQLDSYVLAKYSEQKPASAAQPEVPEEAAPKKPQKKAASVKKSPAEGLEGPERVKKIVEMTGDIKRKISAKRSIQEINSRCSLIWSTMQVRTGWNMTVAERNEWFKQLTQIRYGIGTGELTPEVLDKFLDATEEVYGALPRGE